jgi:hypothetical protein
VRIFKTKLFEKFVHKKRVGDDILRDAVERACGGLIEADLGRGVIKQRGARPGQGRSGGYRMLIAFRLSDLAVFMYGFAKNELDNIGDKELATLRDIAGSWLKADARVLEKAVADGILIEVTR